MLDLQTRQEFLSTIECFVQEKLAPREAKVAEKDSIPFDIFIHMKELGLFGQTISDEFGCLGIGMEDEVYFARAMGRRSPVFRAFICGNMGWRGFTGMRGCSGYMGNQRRSSLIIARQMMKNAG